MKWRCKDGRQIPVKKLEGDHLLNILRMLNRHAKYELLLTVSSYLNGPYPNGDGAQMAFEGELADLTDMEWWETVPKIYFCLLAEANKRKLEVADNLIPPWWVDETRIK